MATKKEVKKLSEKPKKSPTPKKGDAAKARAEGKAKTSHAELKAQEAFTDAVLSAAKRKASKKDPKAEKPAKAPKPKGEPKAKKIKKEKPPKPETICHTQTPGLTDKDLNTTNHRDWKLGVAELKKVCTKKPVTPRASRCHPCKRAVRKEQLRVNNLTWDLRVANGTAGHHSKYRGKPTEIVKKLKAAGMEPEKYIKQGGKGEKAGLPKTVLAKVAKVDLPAVKKPKAPKPEKPTKQQKEAAKLIRRDIALRKSAKAKKAAKKLPEITTPNKLPPMRATYEEVPRKKEPTVEVPKADVEKVQEDLAKLVADAGLPAKPKRTKKPKADKGAKKAPSTVSAKDGKEVVPAVASTLSDIASGVRQHPLEDGEIRASQAIQGRKYEVAGIECEFNCRTEVAGAEKFSFRRLDEPGAAPMLLVPNSPVRPL